SERIVVQGVLSCRNPSINLIGRQAQRADSSTQVVKIRHEAAPADDLLPFIRKRAYEVKSSLRLGGNIRIGTEPLHEGHTTTCHRRQAKESVACVEQMRICCRLE